MTNNESLSTSAVLARKIFDAVGRRDVDSLAACFREDVTIEWLPVGTIHGKEANRDFWAEVLAAVPDVQLDLLNLLSDGDYAVTQLRWRGTFSGGPYIGIHPTGKAVDFPACTVMKFQDGLLAEETVYFDGLGWARQIGLLPAEHTLGDKAMTAAFNVQTDLRAALQHWLGKRKVS